MRWSGSARSDSPSLPAADGDVNPAPSRRIALGIVRFAAAIVPAARRRRWLREWSAEVWARSDEGGPVVWPAIGSLRHATWLRGEAWMMAMDRMLAESGLTLRTLARRPLFSAAVIVTLALGIGATTAVFSVVDKVLVAPLPYPGGDRFFQITADFQRYDIKGLDLNPELFVAWRERAATLEAMEAYSVFDGNLIGVGLPTVVQEGRVTAGFLRDLLSVTPVLGRTFDPTADQPGAERVALLSESLWRERFGSRSDVMGESLHIDDRSFEIVGVLPTVAILPNVDVWTPVELDVDWARDRIRFGSLVTLARARPGVGLADVEQDLLSASERAALEVGKLADPWRAGVFDYRSRLVGDIGANLWILMGAVVAVLLIACVNVANLLLSRGAERMPELLIRSSLGASRGDLARQVFLEGAILATVGGLLGMGLAWVGVDTLLALVPAEIPLAMAAEVDVRVLAFALLLTALTGALFSVIPALRASRVSVRRIRAHGSSISRQEKRRGEVLLGAEVAQASALLVAAILMVNTLHHMSRADAGFDPDGLLFVHLQMPSYTYGGGSDSSLRDRFLEELRPRVAAIPGVQRVGVGSATPFSGMTFLSGLQQEGGPREGASDGGRNVFSETEVIQFSHLWVDGDYLTALGLPVVQGRPLRPSDRGGEPVALINETAAQAYWPNESAVGRRVRARERDPWTTIVGVVKDFEHPGLPTAGQAELYAPLEGLRELVNLLVRFTGDAELIRDRIQREIWAIDPDLPIPAVSTAREALAASLAMTRFYTLLLVAFATLAVTLASVGIYGVVAHSVARRTREMGIRIALGAEPSAVASVVLREGMTAVLLGLTVGLIGAGMGSRVMESLLFEVRPTDPLTYGVVAVVVSVVAATAVWVPARRATRADPVEVLRAN